MRPWLSAGVGSATTLAQNSFTSIQAEFAPGVTAALTRRPPTRIDEPTSETAPPLRPPQPLAKTGFGPSGTCLFLPNRNMFEILFSRRIRLREQLLEFLVVPVNVVEEVCLPVFLRHRRSVNDQH